MANKSPTMCSLVPRPSPAPVFDRLQYTASDQKLLQAIKNWSRGRPGNEANNVNVPITVQNKWAYNFTFRKNHPYIICTLHGQLDECFWILLLAESTVMNELQRTMLGAILL